MQQLSADTTPNALWDSYYGGRIIDYNVEGKPRSVLMTRYFAPQRQAGTIINTNEGMAVEAVDVVSLARRGAS